MSGGGKTTTTQNATTTIDPTILKMQTDNYGRAKGIADTPAATYDGPLNVGLDTSQSQGALGGLLDFNAPQINRGAIRDVSAGTVGADQINQFMNPYINDVVNATGADLEHQRQLARVSDAGKMTAAAGFGNNYRGIQAAETNGAYDRTAATTFAGLRSAGFDSSVSAAQVEAARALEAARANQGYDFSTQQANQGAAISSAGVRAGAATSLAGVQGQSAANDRANQEAAYQEWLRKQNDPILKQGLLNSALSGIQAPTSSTSTGTTTQPRGGLFGTGINFGWSAKDGLSFGST